jgi:hypothetical protein
LASRTFIALSERIASFVFGGTTLLRTRWKPLVDDPARGVFWGPPDESGQYRRWSRAWFEWRSDRA